MAAVEGDEIAPRGNEWEVVSLTASAYAAAPGRQQADMSHDSKGNLGGENKVEASNSMFMSSHFIFPPSQHENLPLEPEYNDDKGGEFDIPQLVADEGGESDVKDEENVKIEELMFDERGNTISDSSAYFQKEKSVSSSAEFQSSHFEATMDKFNTVVDGELTSDIPLPQDNASDSGFLNQEKSTEGENYDCSDLPCEAWWKRRAITVYAQAKETNTFWSIFIAAAVMGLVIIGHRWQQERRQGLNLKWSDQGNEKTVFHKGLGTANVETIILSAVLLNNSSLCGWKICCISTKELFTSFLALLSTYIYAVKVKV